MLQRLCKVFLCTHTVKHHKVIERLDRLYGINTQLATEGVLGKYIGREFIVQLLILDALDNSKSLAVVDDSCSLDDKFLRIHLEHTECSWFDTF